MFHSTSFLDASSEENVVLYSRMAQAKEACRKMISHFRQRSSPPHAISSIDPSISTAGADFSSSDSTMSSASIDNDIESKTQPASISESFVSKSSQKADPNVYTRRFPLHIPHRVRYIARNHQHILFPRLASSKRSTKPMRRRMSTFAPSIHYTVAKRIHVAVEIEELTFGDELSSDESNDNSWEDEDDTTLTWTLDDRAETSDVRHLSSSVVLNSVVPA
ncbi:uncharacterized protein FIBRA_03571 [Fibroporia radiculosa]|uniref:Uncharacterized protein n=1 Tax=Fibroporia radiculosa TaxID=599839 RepID=J4GNJ8_9APHY|nr:uncharacterized protein FIBRA_03571 [Fibroporia radiculosa]CCM01515.1 predicted protein [Fibroporia radiculosa]